MTSSTAFEMFTVRRRSIDSHELRMEYFLVPWDSQIFGRPIAHIEKLEVLDGDRAVVAFQAFETWSREYRIAFTACRLDHRHLREAGWLEGRGFRFVETMLYPRFDSLEKMTPNPLDAVIDIVAATRGDVDHIQTVAASAFVTSRFVIDPSVAPELGAQRYRVWVSNSFADSKHLVLKAMHGDAMVGFFIVEERDDGSAYWHLTAVAPEFQGQGIGKAVWSRMMQWHRERGAKRIDTAVSGHNLPVIGLYGRLGWRFSRSDITLHRGSLAAA